MSQHDALVARLKTLWTISLHGTDVGFEVVDVVERDGHLIVVARTVIWENGSLRDVREQECFFGSLDDYDDDARNVAMAEAFAAVAGEVVAAATPTSFEALMPDDIACGDLAALGNCETRPQFEKALRTKKRLGAHLPTTAPKAAL